MKQFISCITILFLFFFTDYALSEEKPDENLRRNLQAIGKTLNVTAAEALDSLRMMNDTIQAQLEPCTAEDCSNHGTCLGNKESFICLCQTGYIGAQCQDNPCDPKTSCNGKGICIGTSRTYTCICQIGYTGTFCETKAK